MARANAACSRSYDRPFHARYGSPVQVHDYNGGIQPSGLFWVVELPGDAFQVNHVGQRATLEASDVLERYPDVRLRVYVVWVQRWATDAHSEIDGAGMIDQRVTHLWDAGKVIGTPLLERLEVDFGGLDYDFFLLFGRDATWDGTGALKPSAPGLVSPPFGPPHAQGFHPMFHIRVMSLRRPIPTVALLAEAQLLGSFYSRPTPSASHGLRVSGPRTNRARKEEPMRRPVSNSAPPARPGADRASPGGGSWGAASVCGRSRPSPRGTRSGQPVVSTRWLRACPPGSRRNSALPSMAAAAGPQG